MSLRLCRGLRVLTLEGVGCLQQGEWSALRHTSSQHLHDMDPDFRTQAWQLGVRRAGEWIEESYRPQVL